MLSQIVSWPVFLADLDSYSASWSLPYTYPRRRIRADTAPRGLSRCRKSRDGRPTHACPFIHPFTKPLASSLPCRTRIRRQVLLHYVSLFLSTSLYLILFLSSSSLSERRTTHTAVEDHYTGRDVPKPLPEVTSENQQWKTKIKRSMPESCIPFFVHREIRK